MDLLQDAGYGDWANMSDLNSQGFRSELAVKSHGPGHTRCWVEFHLNLFIIHVQPYTVSFRSFRL